MTYANRIGAFLFWVVERLYHPKFGKFLQLEDVKNKIVHAARIKDEKFPELVISYISAAFLIPAIFIRNLRWDLLIVLFSWTVGRSTPTNRIPLLRPSKQKESKEPWDYEGRSYAMYVHILSSAYGWTKKQIDNLDVDFALALVQEILTDEQLDREFLWSMSERSYIYNANTKSGKANPLDRPYFMRYEVQAPKTTKILKSMMPM